MTGRALLGLSLMLLSAGPGQARAQAMRREFAQLHMGMEVRVVLYTADSALAERAARHAFARIETLEDIMSDYRDESEVRRLSHRPQELVPVSRELYQVLAIAAEVARRSRGAFDPTVGPVVRLWRQARETGRLPDPVELARARQVSGYQRLRVGPLANTIYLDTAGMQLDLGGIAKGFILGQAMEEIKRAGVPRAMIIAGGDIVAGEAPPGQPGWRVELEGADAAMTRRAATLANAALSTSGDSEQFAVIGGTRYSHVVNPATGMPLTQPVRVYVIAADPTLADALATAISVLPDSAVTGFMAGYPQVAWTVIR